MVAISLAKQARRKASDASKEVFPFPRSSLVFTLSNKRLTIVGFVVRISPGTRPRYKEPNPFFDIRYCKVPAIPEDASGDFIERVCIRVRTDDTGSIIKTVTE